MCGGEKHGLKLMHSLDKKVKDIKARVSSSVYCKFKSSTLWFDHIHFLAAHEEIPQNIKISLSPVSGVQSEMQF